jgi:Fuc2NAc and GlcNAc transferase
MMLLLVLTVSLGCGAAGAWAIMHWAPALGLLDRPNERSSHSRVTPKGGGIGILLAWVLAAVWLGIPWWFWLPLTFLSMISLIGDRLHLSQILRLAIQGLCCGFVVAALLLEHPLSAGQPWVVQGLLWVGFTMFVVGTANYYNFMDGINGIAGLTAATAFSFLALYSWWYLPATFPTYGCAALSLTAACAGFLPFNMPRARVFMGDVGSILLGALFASYVLRMSATLLDLICLCGFLFPFYADELSTVLVRLKDGHNLLLPHRRHIYQILANQMSIAHWRVSVGYAVLQLAVGFLVLALRPFGAAAVLAALVGVFVLFLLAGRPIRKRE